MRRSWLCLCMVASAAAWLISSLFKCTAQLTEQQRQALRAVRMLLLTNLGILQTRRVSATAELQVLLPLSRRSAERL